MKKVLIIGGCGYIGSRLYQYLSEFLSVVSVDLELYGNPGIDNHKLNFCDLTQNFIQEFDTIVLLAGHSSVKMCEENMYGCFRNNVQYFIELLPKLRNDQQFIYASSSSVYGNLNRNIITETCEEYIPGSFYDLSKSEIDNYMSIADNIEYYGLRFGTVNGVSPNFRTDIMINAMSMSAINKNCIDIYNPMIKRPILWIDDLCRSIKTIIDRGRSSYRGVYNLASFNSTVDIIGRKVQEIFPSSVLHIHDQPTSSNSKVYNFAICSDKFCSVFDFKFSGTASIITEQIRDQISEIRLRDTRNIKDILV